MNWKAIVPEGINIDKMTLNECRSFKQYYDILTRDIVGPKGYEVFYKYLHHLLFYTLCCIEEKKYAPLNKCWAELYPLFGGDDFDNEWLFHCWLACDFPLSMNSNTVLIDKFAEFVLQNTELSNAEQEHLNQFHQAMRASRLGLYQECLSTSKITKFRELFTGKAISTVRSVPYYESGEIFLTRIVSYLGDSFQIHNPQCYPPQYKSIVMDMIERKIPIISDTNDKTYDYECFMKSSGPYWMSSTHPDEDIEIFSPDHYQCYYQSSI